MTFNVKKTKVMLDIDAHVMYCNCCHIIKINLPGEGGLL